MGYAVNAGYFVGVSFSGWLKKNNQKKTPNSVCVQIIQNASLFFATEYDYPDIHKLTANQVEYGIHDNLSNRVLGRGRNIFLPCFYHSLSNP